MKQKDILPLIERRQRQVLIMSFLYYQLNESIISDATFDKWSKELVDLRTKYPKEFAKSAFAKDFETFDGSSGYDLPYSQPWVQSKGYQLLKLHRKRAVTV